MQAILALSSFTRSTVVFAVETGRRMMGASRVNLPMCETHALVKPTVQRSRPNGSFHVLAGTSHCAFMSGATGGMVQAAAVWKLT